MKAAVIQLPASLDSLRIVEREEPAVGPGAVKVRWHALSLNFHDYAIAGGLMPTEEGRVPMSDGAGEIVEVGEGVSDWQVGDKVMSLFFPDWYEKAPCPDTTRRLAGDSTDGCAAQYSVVDPRTLTPIPKGYSYEAAATLPCAALTAWRALVEVGKIKAGDSVLIEGSGGVSIFALQFAKAFGATVYATSSSSEKLERMGALGADHLINYATDPTWGETVYEMAGEGVDHVIDVGGSTTLAQSISAVKMDGSVVLIGILGGMEAKINIAQWMLKQPRIRPIAVGSRAMQLEMVEFLESSDIEPVIDECFPLDYLAEAFRYQLSGQHLGKIVVRL